MNNNRVERDGCLVSIAGLPFKNTFINLIYTVPMWNSCVFKKNIVVVLDVFGWVFGGFFGFFFFFLQTIYLILSNMH